MDKQQPVKISSEITVRSCKYDGSEHRRWTAHLKRRVGSLLVLSGAFETAIEHPLLGRIARGTNSIEHFWTDRWYSVFRFTEPTGELRNYYCNVNVPPILDGDVLSFVDLDIDILVSPDFAFTILDENEFRENALRFKYPMDVKRRVRTAVAELIEMIERRRFPFDVRS